MTNEQLHNKPELRKCPFCGGLAEVCYEHDDLKDSKVMCSFCGAASCPRGIRYEQHLAIADWNARKNDNKELAANSDRLQTAINLALWQLEDRQTEAAMETLRREYNEGDEQSETRSRI